MTDKRKSDDLPPLMSQDEFENSDYGRSPRFPPGWFILPTLFLGAIGWFFFVKWLLS